jgi:Ca2+:H+ antiporter
VLKPSDTNQIFPAPGAMIGLFQGHHKAADSQRPDKHTETKSTAGPSVPTENEAPQQQSELLPVYRVNVNGHRVTKYIAPDGESGRRGIHPIQFFKICWSSASDASRAVNLLWPCVPAALAVRYSRSDLHLAIFVLNYIAMVPCANLIGFAGQELARKLPRVFGILLETTLGSVVEIILFMVLLKNDKYQVIQAAILGSILATLLMCLGMCFFVGGMRRAEQEFDEAVGEVGNGLLLTA